MATNLVFGLELEMILAFSHSLLREHLDKEDKTSRLQIIKSPGDVKRLSQIATSYCRRRYLAWALLDPTPLESPAWATKLLDTRDSTKVMPFRAYLEEPLQLAQAILQTIPDRKQTRIHSELGVKQTDFSEWTVVRDASIESLANEDLRHVFSNDNNPSRDLKMWDSYGIELVTPPYADANLAQKDVADVMSALQGANTPETRHGAIINDQTGLHIHVGQPDGQPFPLSVLQHLAYLIIVYESEFDLLLPIHRRSTANNAEILSNREAFVTECSEPVFRAAPDLESGGELQEMVPLFQPLSEVRDVLFAHSDDDEDQDNGRSALIKAMGSTKQHLVNFSYCGRSSPDQGPATVEFRAHAGSLSAEEVGFWIKHCLALVRLAMRYADSGAQCKVQSWEDDISLESLWEEMGLEEEARAFYRARVTEYRARWPEWKPTPLWEEYLPFDDENWSG